MTQNISQERKATFYIGTAVMVLGGLTFASAIVMFFSNFGESRPMGGGAEFGKAFGMRSFAGMALMIVGGIVRGMGAMGLAGSGVILNPKRARRELEPYSRMAGGMVKDVLDEADVDLGSSKQGQVVMIRCTACRKLNEEDSKFCQECGATI
jgi:predicted RNA-binding Zn-ribbon protein involved in translation (DUF1610 family)